MLTILIHILTMGQRKSCVFKRIHLSLKSLTYLWLIFYDHYLPHLRPLSTFHQANLMAFRVNNILGWIIYFNISIWGKNYQKRMVKWYILILGNQNYSFDILLQTSNIKNNQFNTLISCKERQIYWSNIHSNKHVLQTCVSYNVIIINTIKGKLAK